MKIMRYFCSLLLFHGKIENCMYKAYLKEAKSGITAENIEGYFVPKFNEALQAAVNAKDEMAIKSLFDIRAIEIPKVSAAHEVIWHDIDKPEFFIDFPIDVEISSFIGFIEQGCRPKNLRKYADYLKKSEGVEALQDLADALSANELYALAEEISEIIEEDEA